MKLFYKHENAGTKAEDYKSGDVHIGSAAEGSRITVVTDNSGITMTDEAQIYEILNALAGKLYYDAYKTGEEKLTGQATIAEGLTSSSKTLEMKDMLFKKENGQGYVQGNPRRRHWLIRYAIKSWKRTILLKKRGISGLKREFMTEKATINLIMTCHW